MKAKFSILLILIMSVLTIGSIMFVTAEGEVLSEGGLTYSVNDDSTATVTGFSGEVIENLVIPESLGGYTVSAIGKNAFYRTTVQSVILPSTVRVINSSAFSGCTKLSSVSLNEGLTTIGNYAFNTCSSLTELNYPASLESIESPNTFTNCGVKKVTFAEGTIKIVDNACLNMKYLISVDFPETVTSIGSSAFSGCSSLKSIDLHENIKEIGRYAFNDCSSLTEITLPASLETIGQYGVFSGSGIETVNFAYGTTTILASTCSNMKNLISVEIPDTVISIGSSAFSGCVSLEQISLPETVTVINSYAFSDCSSLKSINLHEGITELGRESFENCSSLTQVTIPASLEKVSGYSVFPGCTKLETVIFANGTTTIPDYICRNMTALKTVDIPDTVTTIGSHSFENCKSLKNIDLKKVETLCEHAFSGCTGFLSITMPETLKYTAGYGEPFEYCSNITSVIFEGTTIPKYFCGNMQSLRTIDMKNGLTAVGYKTFDNADNLEKIIIRDKYCEIPDNENAILSNMTIYGYNDSTAQKYASKYDRNFVEIESVDNYETVIEYVRHQMMNRNNYIILNYPENAPTLTNSKDFVALFDNVFAYNKENSAVGDNLRWSVNKINRAAIDNGHLTLDVNYYTSAEQEKQVNQKIQEIISALNLKEKPDYEKIRLIFEYIVNNTQATSPTDSIYNDIHHSAYSVLLNNIGVCEGFSAAFYRLCLEAGLDVRIVVSNKLLHACNIVKIEDKWYYIDTYLAAKESSSDSNIFYFLKSSIESQFINDDYITFLPDYETEYNWDLTPAEIKAYSFADADYIIDGGCAHILTFAGYSGLPCSGTGKEEYTCPVCDNKFSRSCKLEHLSLPDTIYCQWCNKNLCKHEDKYKATAPGYQATCTEDGITSYEYCSRCKEHNFNNAELIPATGHIDENNDGVCDQCEISLESNDSFIIETIKKFFGHIGNFISNLLKLFKKFL